MGENRCDGCIIIIEYQKGVSLLAQSVKTLLILNSSLTNAHRLCMLERCCYDFVYESFNGFEISFPLSARFDTLHVVVQIEREIYTCFAQP